jgi:hypothetical protein
MSDENNYTVRIGEKIAEIEWLTTPGPAEIDAALTDVLRHPAFCPGMALLFIERGTGFNPKRETVEYCVRKLAAFAGHFDPHVAIAVETEFHYGIGRMFSEVAEPLGFLITPFREVELARQWLLAQRADSQILPGPRPPKTEGPVGLVGPMTPCQRGDRLKHYGST